MSSFVGERESGAVAVGRYCACSVSNEDMLVPEEVCMCRAFALCGTAGGPQHGRVYMQC